MIDGDPMDEGGGDRIPRTYPDERQAWLREALPLTLNEATGILHDLRAAGWSEAILDRLRAALAAQVPHSEPCPCYQRGHDDGFRDGHD